MTNPWIVCGALAVEAAIGYPAAAQRLIPHPVVGIGKLIAALETRLNRDADPESLRRALGLCTLVVIMIVAMVAAHAATFIARHMPLGSLLVIAVASLGFAQRSLYEHVAAVSRALDRGSLHDARVNLAHIVGRDVEGLDAGGITAAALESLSESFNDGVVAPVFWFAVAGLPGLFIYKTVNTADSMIGHMEPRWRAFGWAAAHTDDLLNLIPARLAGIMIVVVGRSGWTTMRSDAPKHASPNAGWPEAAMAGALKVQLGGAATYDGVLHNRPIFGEGARPTPGDLHRGLHIYIRACAVLWGVFAVGGLLWRP